MSNSNNTLSNKPKFSELLKELLIINKTTQQELAKVLGVQRQTVSLYVNGQIRPDIESLALISNYFDVTTDWLLGLTNDSRRIPATTDELGLSEISIEKIKSYYERRIHGDIKNFSSIDLLISHDDFEELIQSLDFTISSCSEMIMATSCGEKEDDYVNKAISLSSELECTLWAITTRAKIAEYNFFSTQKVFNKILSDLSDVDKIHDNMEY